MLAILFLQVCGSIADDDVSKANSNKPSVYGSVKLWLLQ